MTLWQHRVTGRITWGYIPQVVKVVLTWVVLFFLSLFMSQHKFLYCVTFIFHVLHTCDNHMTSTCTITWLAVFSPSVYPWGLKLVQSPLECLDLSTAWRSVLSHDHVITMWPHLLFMSLACDQFKLHLQFSIFVNQWIYAHVNFKLYP